MNNEFENFENDPFKLPRDNSSFNCAVKTLRIINTGSHKKLPKKQPISYKYPSSAEHKFIISFIFSHVVSTKILLLKSQIHPNERFPYFPTLRPEEKISMYMVGLKCVM